MGKKAKTFFLTYTYLMRLCYSTKTVFKIPINLRLVPEIFMWISTYYHKYKHAQPLDL